MPGRCETMIERRPSLINCTGQSGPSEPILRKGTHEGREKTVPIFMSTLWDPPGKARIGISRDDTCLATTSRSTVWNLCRRLFVSSSRSFRSSAAARFASRIPRITPPKSRRRFSKTFRSPPDGVDPYFVLRIPYLVVARSDDTQYEVRNTGFRQNVRLHQCPYVGNLTLHRRGHDHRRAHEHGAAVLAALAADEVAVGGGRAELTALQLILVHAEAH